MSVARLAEITSGAMPVCLPCGVSIGLDENNCPVIIEYKRHSNENVINQGLYYLDWLLAHRAEFRLLVMETCGRKLASNIEWKGARVLCIAADFKTAMMNMPLPRSGAISNLSATNTLETIC